MFTLVRYNRDRPKSANFIVPMRNDDGEDAAASVAQKELEVPLSLLLLPEEEEEEVGRKRGAEGKLMRILLGFISLCSTLFS